MTWDFVESNPFSASTGNFVGQVDYLAKVVERCPAQGEAVITYAPAQQADVPEQALISTDPPYYDNVPYADISDFFYVWLRRALRSDYRTYSLAY
jgi:putative DNA methylase